MKIDKAYKTFPKSLLMVGVGIFCALITESAMAIPTDYIGGVYTHGSAATLNPFSTKSKIQHLAEGSMITIKPGGQAIVDIAVPVPTLMFGTRTKLLSIEPRYDGDAMIVGLLAQDGVGPIHTFQETWTGTATGSGPLGNGTGTSANFDQPGPNLYSGLGVTLTIQNTCSGHKCKSQTMLITGVGADYYFTVP